MDLCDCGNQARYTCLSGRRSCALCCLSEPAIRDLDLPQFMDLVWRVLHELEEQRVSTSSDYRRTIKWLMGIGHAKSNNQDHG